MLESYLVREKSEYLLQQPKTLEDVAVEQLASTIALQAKKYLTTTWELFREYDTNHANVILSREIRVIRDHLYHHIPKQYYNEIAYKTIKELADLAKKEQSTMLYNSRQISDRRIKIIGRISECFFTEDLTSLCVTVNYSKYSSTLNILRDSLNTMSLMISDLVRLELNFEGYYDKIMTESEIIQLLKNLRVLKYLTIKYATDNILNCIADNCDKIEELRVSGNDLDDDSMLILKRMSNLRSLNLTRTAVGARGVETVLLGCKCIEEIAFDRYICKMSHILNDISQSTVKFPKLFKLTKYFSNFETFEELKVVVEMCPLIRNLYVKSCRAETNHLQAITDLQNLLELTLDGHYFNVHKINDVLATIGRKLVELHLIQINEMDLQALVDIGQSCPSLRSLSLCDCVSTGPVIPPVISCTRKTPNQPFLNLKTLTVSRKFRIIGNFGIHLQHIREAVYFLLSNCLNIEFIHLDVTCLSEEFMLNVLDKNPMIHLKELNLHYLGPISDKMTTLILDKIKQNCMDHPTVVSHLL